MQPFTKNIRLILRLINFYNRTIRDINKTLGMQMAIIIGSLSIFSITAIFTIGHYIGSSVQFIKEGFDVAGIIMLVICIKINLLQVTIIGFILDQKVIL